MIIPVWQKIGESTHLLAKKIGADKNDKATHTGTLDPMAEGVVIVLAGEDRYKKSEFSSWKKTYQFEILFGVSTDSLDLLGLQTDLETKAVDANESKKKITTILPSFLGKQKQQQPKFSAQRIDGKSAFDLAKQKQRFETKTNNIEIFSLKILDSYLLTIEELEKMVNQKISLIKGDFRQKKILNNWKTTFSKLKESQIKNLPIIKLETTVSKKTYIRSLVRDISQKIKLPATTFSITRTKNGAYGKNDCYNIQST